MAEGVYSNARWGVTLCVIVSSIHRMIELLKISDPVLLQILTAALESNNIPCHIENAGMNALMPLPTLMDARVLIAAADESAAQQVLRDLEMAP